MPLRSPPPVSNIVRTHSRDPQTNQVHLPSLHLPFLRFCTGYLPLLKLFLASVVRFCGLIDIVCGGNGGDTGKTCVKYFLWGWFLLRFLAAVVV